MTVLKKLMATEALNYVHDLFADYAEQQGYKNLKIKVAAGDYEKTEFPGTPYDSVHLKNAEVSFYHNQMDGDELSSTEQSISDARRVLQKLANLSKDGLYFNVVFHPNFVPAEEMKAMVSGEFYQETQNWPEFYYYFPEGQGKVISLVKIFLIACEREIL